MPVPLVEFGFNEGAHSRSFSTGAYDLQAWLLVNRLVGDDPATRWTAAGMGVSGDPGDHAFDNSDSALSGQAFVDPSPALSGLNSFTVSGWINQADLAQGAGGQIFHSRTSGTDIMSVSLTADHRLRLSVNGEFVDSTPAYASVADGWTYFAVSYDAQGTDGNVQFHLGQPNAPVEVVHTASLDRGPLTTGDRLLVLGSGLGGSSAFAGLIDNLRVHGNVADATGVLDWQQLETMRLEDVNFELERLHTQRETSPLRPNATLVEVRKIWDNAPHNAFTDLIRFNDEWYLTFREADVHQTSAGGQVRIIRSSDAANWETAAVMAFEGQDVRELKFLETPDNHLVAFGAAADLSVEPYPEHRSYAWISDDGREWSDAYEIDNTSYTWMWRGARYEDYLYSVGYGTHPADRGISIYRSEDGVNWSIEVPDVYTDYFPNESPIHFLSDGTMIMLNRREGMPGANTSQFGMASAPYDEWQWHDLGRRLGGPNMIELPDGRIIVGARLWEGGTRTALAWLDLETGELEEFLTLPSQPDTGYPGLVWHDDHLWVSYYSDPTGQTSVYLAKVHIELIPEPASAMLLSIGTLLLASRRGRWEGAHATRQRVCGGKAGGAAFHRGGAWPMARA